MVRDPFTEDGGGWFEDVALLDRLTLEKLETLAADIRQRDGWK
jgi:ParB family chromosome partitioning protein